MWTRRKTLKAALALVAGHAAAPRAGLARTSAADPLSIIVPFPPGGPHDLLADLIARHAPAVLNRPVDIAYRAGRHGIEGTEAGAREPPDGLHLVLGNEQTHAANPALVSDCPYDPVSDFVPVAGLARIPHVLIARHNLRIDSVADLVASARQMPDNFHCGAAGAGSASHLAAEMFKARTGTDLRHIPYRSARILVSELAGARVDLGFVLLPDAAGLVRSGAAIALAVASAQRTSLLPDVPTLREAGVAGVEADAWLALFAPAGTPVQTADRLYEALVSIFAEPQVAAAAARGGVLLALRSPAEFAALLPAEIAKWTSAIRDAYVSLD